MPSDASLPSASVDTTLAPASPSGMRPGVNLSANGSPPADSGPRLASLANPILSSPPPVGSNRSQSQPLSSPYEYGAKHPRISGFAPPHVPLGSPSQHPQAADNLYAAKIGAATAPDSAQRGPSALSPPSLSDLGPSPASWPGLYSPSNPLSPLDFGLGPAALHDLLPALSSYPTSTASLHASSFSAFRPGPVSPPASVGVGAGSSHASPPPRPGTDSAFPFPPGAPPPAPIPPPGFGPGGAFLDALPPISPPSRDLSPPYFGIDAASMQALPRSLSADATAPQHAHFGVVHLLRRQLSFLVQAWMADRECLEPRRQQTEEEIQRMRAAMDSAREQWTSERSVMEHQVEVLKAQVCQLQDENAAFKAAAGAAAQTSNGNRVQPPVCQHDDGLHAPAGNGPAAALLPPNPSRQSSSSKPDVFSLPPGLDGASRRPHFASPGSSRTSPAGATVPSQPAPLDPRTQPQNSAPNDFLAPLSTDGKLPASVIDVQEIDPKLEGIPIKADAVQRCTFAPAGGQASPASSARKNGLGRDSQAPRWSPHNLSMDRGTASLARRASSRDQTMQVLAAEESRRLTMHAGHTPNHSFSLLPTMTATGGDSTGCQSRGATPSAGTQSVSTDNDEASSPGDHDDGVEQEPETDPDLRSLHVAPEDMQGHLEPQDDVLLKGPLMIKNIPAQDDVFFAQLDQKLESLGRGQNALPSVLQVALEGSEQVAAGPSCLPVPHAQSVGGDASHDSRSVPEEEEAEGDDGKHMEPEVPLKFRTTSNFGAPFGSM
ncbi:Uncharacterized protein TPAR_06897 [Tolypocladium paradoxum]|uniref:Uncharacterized protein n=1 Tax=Tolypocladium paradoxum TaxID=94208 RepID=A0A2S4KRS1_9HYPO|nr:Uncharacterized protein TPAR_06897 [Tolypocladium paradoxum]